MLVACGCASESPHATMSLPVALPSPPPLETSAPPLAHAKSTLDVADFTSGRGQVHLTREGATAAGSFGASGVVTCGIAGDHFDCHWYENTTEGLAVLQRKADGKLEGTWGVGASADDHGAWTLVPVVRSDDSPFGGLWDTNFGAATIRTASGSADLAIDYRDGTMQCKPTGDKLACAWTEGSTHGKAELTIESPRVMRGTWGNDASATDGGAWLFVRR